MKQSGNIKIILVIIATLAIGVLIYYKSKPDTSSNSTSSYSSTNSKAESTKSAEQTKAFQSKNMRFSINVPLDFATQEKFTTLILTKNDNEIKISRVATNFDNLEDYLVDLSNKNKFTVLDSKKLIINEFSSVQGNINQERIYFIYADSWVFSMSTTSEALFDDLDQIAKSFQYTP